MSLENHFKSPEKHLKVTYNHLKYYFSKGHFVVAPKRRRAQIQTTAEFESRAQVEVLKADRRYRCLIHKRVDFSDIRTIQAERREASIFLWYCLE